MACCFTSYCLPLVEYVTSEFNDPSTQQSAIGLTVPYAWAEYLFSLHRLRQPELCNRHPYWDCSWDGSSSYLDLLLWAVLVLFSQEGQPGVCVDIRKRRLDRSWTIERNHNIKFRRRKKKKRRRIRRVTSSPTIAAPPPLLGPTPPPPPPADEPPPSPQPPIPTTIFNPGQFWNPTELERDMASRTLPLDLPNLNSSVSALPSLYGNLGISQSENVLRDTGQG
jgi:hypothetical protein